MTYVELESKRSEGMCGKTADSLEFHLWSSTPVWEKSPCSWVCFSTATWMESAPVRILSAWNKSQQSKDTEEQIKSILFDRHIHGKWGRGHSKCHSSHMIVLWSGSLGYTSLWNSWSDSESMTAQYVQLSSAVKAKRWSRNRRSTSISGGWIVGPMNSVSFSNVQVDNSAVAPNMALIFVVHEEIKDANCWKTVFVVRRSPDKPMYSSYDTTLWNWSAKHMHVYFILQK